MKNLSRREFLGVGAMGLVAARQLKFDDAKSFARKLNAPLCFQSWGMKDQLSEDFDGTLKKIRQIGYDGVEMCSPISYKQFAKFKSVSPSDLKRRIEDTGLTCKSCHFSAWELEGDKLPGTIEYAKKLGLTGVIFSSSGIRNDSSLDEWKQFADKANAAGKAVKAAGMQAGYHNHTIGPVIEGKPLEDHLMELLDPDLVKMQFQLQTIAEGYNIYDYLDKYSGRFIAMHMHDWDPKQKKVVPIGDGIIDWPRLIKTAQQSDIAPWGYIVEIETEEPFEGLVRSHAFLNKLTV